MAVLLLSGCMSLPTIPETSKLAVYPEKTPTQQLLGVLPPPARPVAVAVYSFEDLTGQFKPSETGQTLSRAVSQRSEEHTPELHSLMRLSYAVFGLKTKNSTRLTNYPN